MDDLIYVKFINEQIGYGVFAKVNIEPDIIIGQYTGVLREALDSETVYSWNYKSDSLQLKVDSENRGLF